MEYKLIPPTDEEVAALLASDAKTLATKYREQGIGVFLRTRTEKKRTIAVNQRFFKTIVQEAHASKRKDDTGLRDDVSTRDKDGRTHVHGHHHGHEHGQKRKIDFVRQGRQDRRRSHSHSIHSANNSRPSTTQFVKPDKEWPNPTSISSARSEFTSSRSDGCGTIHPIDIDEEDDWQASLSVLRHRQNQGQINKKSASASSLSPSSGREWDRGKVLVDGCFEQRPEWAI